MYATDRVARKKSDRRKIMDEDNVLTRLTRSFAENALQSRLEKALKLDEYKYLTENCNPTDYEYQKRFCAMYKISGAGKSKEWKKAFFEVFAKYKKEAEKREISFEEVLRSLESKDCMSSKCEAVFASKLLATLNPKKPILDSRVFNFFGVKIHGNNVNERVENSIELYAEIERKYEDYLQTQNAKDCITFFDEKFPAYKSFSDIKKIDFFIWTAVQE